MQKRHCQVVLLCICSTTSICLLIIQLPPPPSYPMTHPVVCGDKRPDCQVLRSHHFLSVFMVFSFDSRHHQGAVQAATMEIILSATEKLCVTGVLWAAQKHQPLVHKWYTIKALHAFRTDSSIPSAKYLGKAINKHKLEAASGLMQVALGSLEIPVKLA